MEGGIRSLDHFLNILVQECPLLLEQWRELYFINDFLNYYSFFWRSGGFRTLNFWAWFLSFLYFSSCPQPHFLGINIHQGCHCGLAYFPSLFLKSQCSNPLASDLVSVFSHQRRMLYFWVHVLCVPSPLGSCHSFLSFM